MMGWQWHQQEQVFTGLMSLLLPIKSVKALHGAIHQTQMTVHKFKRTKLSYTVRSLYNNIMLLLCSKCTCIDSSALLLLLHLFNGFFFQQNLGKPAPERQTILDFTKAREDGVAMASAGPYANHLHLAADK